jgi:hypothetical protein
MRRDEETSPPDVLESGGPGPWLAGISRLPVALVLVALAAGLVIATLAALYYRAQANRLRHLARSSRSPAVVVTATPQVSSVAAVIPPDGTIRGTVVIIAIHRGAHSELLITAYLSGAKPDARYALMGNDCTTSNVADHPWASGVANSQGIAVLTGRPWAASSGDEYWAFVQPSANPIPPGLHGSFAEGEATVFRAGWAPCTPG